MVSWIFNEKARPGFPPARDAREAILKLVARRCDDQTIHLRLVSKTSGVPRLYHGRLVGSMVKGLNEVEGVAAHVKISIGDTVIEQQGDFSSVN